MPNIRLKRSVRSYILRIYKTPDSENLNWRLILSPINPASDKNKGFQTIEDLGSFLSTEIENMEKFNE